MGDDNSETAVPAIPAVFHLTERDKEILSITDEQYHLQTWSDLKFIIARNELEKLTRLPSQLRKYLAWSAETKQAYGNMTNFLLQKRLYWTPVPGSLESGNPVFEAKSPLPFGAREDRRILINDWPYGLEKGITHVCVWLKVRLPVDDRIGDLTAEGRKMVLDFVENTFERGLGLEGQDRVLWFKNWTGLQSVRGLEHIHVLLRGVEQEKIDQVVENACVDS